MYDICIDDIDFEWDSEKDSINLEKHGIDFTTEKNVFLDPDRIELFDDKHSTLGEYRYLTIGSVGCFTVVIALVYTQRSNNIRIISARNATKKEKEAYYNGCCKI